MSRRRAIGEDRGTPRGSRRGHRTGSRSGSLKSIRCGMKQQLAWTLMACIAVFTSGTTLAERSATGIVKPLQSVQFSPDNDVKCLSSAVEAGDPTAGPSTWILKASSGCVVPWHFHTAEEQLIIISGAVVAEMIDHPPHAARARRVCHDGEPHAASVLLPRQVRVPDDRRLRSGL
jgi:hypothetical protein